MKPMMETEVLPWLRRLRGDERVYVSRTLQTFGMTESGLDEAVAGAVDPAEGRVSFRASFPEVSVRVVVHGRPEEASARLETLAGRLRERIAPYVYAEGSTTLEEVVGRLLTERVLTVALAESCTGGLIGHRLTNVPGSSAYLRGAVVAYADAAKEALLGVRRATLAAHGAVSEETAAEMAAGARRAFGAALGLATTGIAGPSGGTPEKPVGTVCLGLAADSGTVTRRYQLWGTRDWVKLLASQLALDWIRRHLLGLPVTEARLFRPR
jgi:nicotinamide-nucleotide amidase